MFNGGQNGKNNWKDKKDWQQLLLWNTQSIYKARIITGKRANNLRDNTKIFR
jgi:hypothetical protein